MSGKDDTQKAIEALQKQVSALEEQVKNGAGKQKKARKPRDPNAKPNPYIEFGKKMRKEHTDEWKGKSVGEVGKLIGKLWQDEKKKKEDAAK